MQQKIFMRKYVFNYNYIYWIILFIHEGIRNCGRFVKFWGKKREKAKTA